MATDGANVNGTAWERQPYPTTSFAWGAVFMRHSKDWPPMSESGHSRRFDRLRPTSGLTRTTDINAPTRLVRFVPEGDVPSRSARHAVWHDLLCATL